MSALIGLGSAEFATGNVQAGAEVLKRASALEPSNVGLLTQLGVALSHAGYLQDAQETFLQALEIDDKNIDAIISLAQLCRLGRNFVEAIDLLQYANRLEPENPYVIAAIGTVALELGDRPAADEALRNLKQLAPDHGETQMLEQAIADAG